LSRREFNTAVLEVNIKLSLHDVKEFVVVVVLVPVVLSLHDAETNDRLIHLAKSLVVPLMKTGVGERFLVDHLSLLVINIKRVSYG
jgi:hypothetical protein